LDHRNRCPEKLDQNTLCRERAAKRPQDFSVDAKIAGAALRPFRDTRPLLQGSRLTQSTPTNPPVW
ncbi:hypothetical protein BTA49_24735, partial [Pseudomonas mosselii]